ncbi:hypothetical protein XM75_c11828 [Vibrio vulnificus]|uniref:DUF262 domain-containing protein n=1 Tax=Vibrio TaxID=662 RepID=UPI0009B5E07D|nr:MULTISPECIES: DUF262 domain-containing protein [Vibrio]ASG07654.1 hypothetical protein CEQ50_08815 [Vibrio anguillarum]OQK50251.1 hypothetical protein XM75_c11828 [Vibrio vulnificus]
MSRKLTIETKVRRLVNWMDSIRSGNLQVPKFQRDFVWDMNAVKDLFDSIKNGYPIGSILMWKPESESFERSDEMGGFELPAPDGPEYWFILDGFQRLSALFGCLNNPNSNVKLIDKDLWEKKFNVFYDLSTEEFLVPRSKNMTLPYQVPLYQLVDTKAAFSFQTQLLKAGLTEEKVELYMERYADLGSAIIDYEIPSININGGRVDEAVEIFSRVNSKGTDISPDWMISALTYNRDRDFRLGTLIDGLLIRLEQYNFQNVPNPRDLILKCITHSFGKAYFDQSNNLAELAKRKDFIGVAKRTIESIEKAAKFLYEELLVLDGKQLPYVPQLIFVSDFFNTLDNPSQSQIDDLKKWFWMTTYSNYFTIYTISKQREAYNQFRAYLHGGEVDILYNDKPNVPFKAAEFPKKINAGSVRSNALILFMLNQQKHKKFHFENLDGMYLSYLFRDVKNEGNALFPESVVPRLKSHGDKFRKFIDPEDLINVDLADIFLTDDMLQVLSSNSSEEEKIRVLKTRKRMIIEAEKEFVESFGIEYEV